jgi:valyl-tRNA synthetase
VTLVGASLAVARPCETFTEEGEEHKRDIFLCLDVSYSIFSQNEMLVSSLKDFVRGLDGERFGISIFNSSSVVYVPMTDDYEYVISMLDELERYFKMQIVEVNDLYSKYRLNEALMAVFKLFTDEFSGWYLEMIKPAYQAPVDADTFKATLNFFEQLMKIIHPFMPFITEELYQHIAERKDGESIMVDTLILDAPTEADKQLMAQYEEAKQVISGVRAVRQSKNISPREPLVLEVVIGSPDDKNVTKCPAMGAIIKKMASLSDILYVQAKSDGSKAQLWRIVVDKKNRISFKGVVSHKVVALKGVHVGASVLQRVPTGGAAEKWKIYQQ